MQASGGGSPVPNDQVLTQYGTSRKGFHNQPRWERETQLSVIMGRLTPREAGDFVRRHGAQLPFAGDRARYTTAGRLRANGFTVDQTGNDPRHVSVGYPLLWNAEVCKAFDAAFEADGDNHG